VTLSLLLGHGGCRLAMVQDESRMMMADAARGVLEGRAMIAFGGMAGADWAESRAQRTHGSEPMSGEDPAAAFVAGGVVPRNAAVEA
jgi:hypothetical protein